VTITSIERHDRVYGQNNQYLQGQASVFDQSMNVDLPGGKTVLVTSYGFHLNMERGFNSETL
jgi:hypothetical protein